MSQAQAPLDSEAMSNRLGLPVRSLEVVGVDELTATMRRVITRFDGATPLVHEPGQDMMLTLPDGAGSQVRRRYTIRSLDPERSLLALDVLVHGHGPGSQWAATVTPGERVEAIGPRGNITVQPDAEWHLFAGDESYAPAALAMAESLPPGAAADVILVVDSASHHLPESVGASVGVHWVHRDGSADLNDGDRVVAAFDELEPRPGSRHAYLGGELGNVRAVQRALLERGFTDEQVSPKNYWRAGQANAAHGEPRRD